jgi:hypothetical protein
MTRFQGGFGTSGRGEVAEKRGRKMNRCKKCVHVCINAKMRTVQTIPGMGGRGEIKERGGGVNSSMIYLIHCKTFVNATMYPHPAQ